MKKCNSLLKRLPAFLLAGLLALLPNLTRADLLGAEIQYKTQKDSLYITLNTFEDYAYGRSAYINSYIDVASISTNTKFSVNLKQLTTKDITSTCSKACTNYSSIFCNNENTLVKKVYTAKLYVGEFSANDCDLKISWSSYYRPKSVEKFYIETVFNRCIEGGNSSPKIINDPYHILALNEAYSYSWKATDSDGDSLVYELIEARVDELNGVDYEKGLSHKIPFNYYGQPQNNAKFPKGFHFDNNNGLLRFLPTKNASNPVVVSVSEYRNGTRIGQTVRDIQMTVKNISNKKPIVSGINGTNKEFTQACANQEICFYVQAEDGDSGDEVEFTWETDIDNATVTKVSGKKPMLEFCWTPSKKELREMSYFLKVTAKDNSCELSGKYERVINIKVVEPFDVKFSNHVSACKELTFSTETNFENPNKLVYDWQIEEVDFYGKELKYDFTKDGGSITAHLTATNEQSGCQAMFTKQIALPSHPNVFVSGNKKACKNSSIPLNANGAKTYKWLDVADNNLGFGSTLEYELTEATTLILKGEDKYGCADYDTIVLDIIEPEISATAIEQSVCKGLPIEIVATGALNYQWSQNGLSKQNHDVATYVLKRNEIIQVSGIDKNGCEGTYDVNVKVDQDCVWPGDVNGDELVNNKDVLYVGLSYNTKNPNDAKQAKSTFWQPYQSENWNESFADNRNYKHADANDDGIIDYTDLLVIDKFYSREVIYTNKKNGNGYKLYFDYDVDSLKNKEVIEVTVSLGTKADPAKDVYGIAFTIDYNDIVDTGSISFNTDNSWLAEGSNTIKLVKNIPSTGSAGGGKIDIAFSRTSKKPKSGSGKVGSVKFVVQDDIDWKKLHFIELMLEGIEVIDANGGKIDAYGENTSIQLSDLYSSANSTPKLSGVSAFPNPTENGEIFISIDDTHQSVKVSLVSISGQTIVAPSTFNTGVHQLNTNGIKSGYYLVIFNSNNGKYTLPLIVK
ncbi:MAG: T9SS type A sorting domain-containing protein [Bacteroidia bacterium]